MAVATAEGELRTVGETLGAGPCPQAGTGSGTRGAQGRLRTPGSAPDLGRLAYSDRTSATSTNTPGAGHMGDLGKDSESIAKAAPLLRKSPHHIAKPLQDFKAASHDLSALGALGALMSATDDVREGMEELAQAAEQLSGAWRDEAKLMTDLSEAFDLLDLLLEAAAQGKKG
ncbi:hypothetical protein [Streptomyces sp. NPDC058308]|uniref:hypothetical protein n=1 Tax=Streptomyces sp. NPDC058308 TaxID=3346440 RepID=UPI0036E0ADC0